MGPYSFYESKKKKKKKKKKKNASRGYTPVPPLTTGKTAKRYRSAYFSCPFKIKISKPKGPVVLMLIPTGAFQYESRCK